MTYMKQGEEQWEIFNDDAYYNLWCVRNIGDRSFNSPLSYHFEDKADADKFLELVRKAK